MPRYINADLAPIYLNDIACEQIKQMPTADVVEVVRCKDCKYYKTKPFTGEKLCIKHKQAIDRLWRSNPDDYCSYGDRKEDE